MQLNKILFAALLLISVPLYAQSQSGFLHKKASSRWCLGSTHSTFSIPEGTKVVAEISLTINENGKVEKAEILKSSEVKTLDEVAIQEYSTCEFDVKANEGENFPIVRTARYSYEKK